jgi:formylglycine-generating enzyme required for sulfatase activity
LGDPRDLDEVVFVPGGPFLMGSEEGDVRAYDDEHPQHTVEVGDFCIGKYPVTNSQFARFVEAGGYDERRYWTEAGWEWRRQGEREMPDYRNDPAWNLPNHPVVGVSWFEALAYTRWLAELTGRPYRLPTEAEWEKAARGTDGRIYPWSDKWAENNANTAEIGIASTTAVGSFPEGASPYEVLDMSGNVLEWCTSAVKPDVSYPYQPADGREDLERLAVRGLRGGSWLDYREGSRCACRGGADPVLSSGDVGIRVVFPEG